MKIVAIKALEILDSRGNPTIKTYVTLDDGTMGSASVPSGASTGSHEALELRDKDERYLGLGVQDAVLHVNGVIAHALTGHSIQKLRDIDEKMQSLDGTPNESKLGANAILSVSLACAQAYANSQNIPLWKALNSYYFEDVQVRFPRLMVNVMNGGAHADWVFDIQEFMISPKETVPSTSVEIAANIFHTLKKLLDVDGFSIAVGDEGGFAPDLGSNEKALEYIERAIREAGYTRNDVGIALDIAASEFYHDEKYVLRNTSSGEEKMLSSAELNTYLTQLSTHFSLFSLEDPFAEDDWEHFARFTAAMGKDRLIVGDDLFVTDPERIARGIEKKAANAVLIKVNQIGTLSETVEAINLAQRAGWKVIISHRSGETTDTFISDLAVACGADFIKAGSMSRSERLAKYNRLLEIEKLEW